MSTKNPRVMVVLESPLHRWVRRLAKVEGLSVSMKLRDLVREAYEAYEDRYWSRIGAKRLKTLKSEKLISHEEFWKKAGV